MPVLETLVQLDLSPDLLPEDIALLRVDLSALETTAPGGWREDGPADPIGEAESKAFGDRGIEEAGTPVLKVPSVVAAESFNLVLNARHPLASSIPEPTSRPFALDTRLFEHGSGESE